MKTLLDLVPGTPHTIRRVTGDRLLRRRLEDLGIAAGADVTLLSAPTDDPVLIRVGQRELGLSPADAARIVPGPLFQREGDPLLMSSCCSGGNTCGLWDRINEEDTEA